MSVFVYHTCEGFRGLTLLQLSLRSFKCGAINAFTDMKGLRKTLRVYLLVICTKHMQRDDSLYIAIVCCEFFCDNDTVCEMKFYFISRFVINKPCALKISVSVCMEMYTYVSGWSM